MVNWTMFKLAICLFAVLVFVTIVRSSDVKGNVSLAEDSNESTENATVRPSQTYKEAEKEITDFINNLLRSLLPQIVGGSGDAKLSAQCTAGMMKLFGNIRRMKGWTVKMLDSMGKPSSGILQGTSYSMGSYDECVNLRVTSKGAEAKESDEAMFQGQYCRIRIRFPEVVIEKARSYHQGVVNASDLGKLKDIIQVIPYIPVKSNYMNHFLGLCFPSICLLEDLQQLAKLIPFPGTARIDRCDVKSNAEVDSLQLIIICIFLVLVLLVVISTFIHWLLHSNRNDKMYHKKDKRCVNLSLSFSICNNSSRLTRNIEDDTLGLLAGQSVRGIVVASITWIVLGNTYLFPYEGYYFHMSSLANLKTYWDSGYFSAIVSYPLAIDALFVCFGFLLTFSLWQPVLQSKDIEINIVSLIIKNYVRLCIPLLLFFGIVILLPLFGSGPFWGDLLEDSIDRCRTNAAAHFGMFSNFLNLEDQCFPHLWFVSCLAQLTLIGIVISFISSRNLKLGVGVTVIICILCNCAVGLFTLTNEFPPSYVSYFAENSSSLFWQVNMAFPLIHFGPYATGMFSGILIARNESHRSRQWMGAVGWITCLGLLYAIHVVLFQSRDGSLTPYWSGIFAGLHKTAFGLCTSWILVSCSFGVGGFVNAIFSWRIFDPLFRLSYYVYIFHFLLIAFVVSISREHFSYSHLELILRAFSYCGAAFIISYMFYMLLEMPLVSLRAALFPKKASQMEVTPLNNFPLHKGDFVSKCSTIEGTCKLWSITETHNGVSY